MRRSLLLIPLALTGLAIPVAGAVTAGGDPPVEAVCPDFTTGHLSAGGATSFTYTAPGDYFITAICVKAGSAVQGDGPEIIYYDPPVKTATFSHSSGKAISHFSVLKIIIVTPTTTTIADTTTTSTTLPPPPPPPPSTSTTTTVADTTTTEAPDLSLTVVCSSAGPDYGSWLVTNTGSISATVEGVAIPPGGSHTFNVVADEVTFSVVWANGAEGTISSVAGANDCTYTPPVVTTVPDTSPPTTDPTVPPTTSPDSGETTTTTPVCVPPTTEAGATTTTDPCEPPPGLPETL